MELGNGKHSMGSKRRYGKMGHGDAQEQMMAMHSEEKQHKLLSGKGKSLYNMLPHDSVDNFHQPFL